MRIIILFMSFLAIGFALSPPLRAASGVQPLIKIKKAPGFILPLDCALRQDCWVMNYLDFGPQDGVQSDPACLERTTDAHKGTDFALPDGAAMQGGVDVLAALDGTVVKVRDGEPDRWPTAEDIEKVKESRKECGNAILIDHDEGLETLYCHLKNGSVIVKPGQKVKQGQNIAQVGLSGLTEFPHLHFGVLENGKIIDPFTGQENTGRCNSKHVSYWQKNLDVQYQPLVIQATGFSGDVPTLTALEKDITTGSQITVNSPVMAYWVILLGVRAGDEIHMKITDPNGKLYAERKITQDKTRARQFYSTGFRTQNHPLSEGAYTASVKITRPDKNGHPPQTWTRTTAALVRP
jgi:biotin carboxyl carrier protein